MPIKQLANDTAKEILASLDGDADPSEDIKKIIEKALVTALREARQGCVEVVNVCCNPDQDLAHKIADKLKLKEKALIANLSSLR